jgi:hypothetical protein
MRNLHVEQTRPVRDGERSLLGLLEAVPTPVALGAGRSQRRPPPDHAAWIPDLFWRASFRAFATALSSIWSAPSGLKPLRSDRILPMPNPLPRSGSRMTVAASVER